MHTPIGSLIAVQSQGGPQKISDFQDKYSTETRAMAQANKILDIAPPWGMITCDSKINSQRECPLWVGSGHSGTSAFGQDR